MAKFSIKAGTTSNTIDLFIQDKTKTDGSGLTGLLFNTAGLTAYYFFARTATTQITLVTLASVTTAWTSGGFLQIDSTNAPGWYRLDLPDAVVAAGNGRFVNLHLRGGGNMADVPVEIELTGTDNQDSVRGGMTALPNAAAGASGGLIINGSNTGTVTLAALTVTGTFTVSDGFLVSRTSANSSAVVFTGLGTGHGLDCESGSGATGDGIHTTSNATNGNGIAGLGAGTGGGGKLTGGSVSAGTGPGLDLIGGASGGVGHPASPGLRSTGGAQGSSAGGDGAVFNGTSSTGASNGITVNGANAGNGLAINAGVTGTGLTIAGGVTSGSAVSITTTSGSGIVVTPTNGHGIQIAANGANTHGIVSTGGTSGVCDGVRCVAGTGGVDLRANITGNLTGNVSGSVGSITTVSNIATAVWTDTTGSDFTVNSSPGKIIVTQLGGTFTTVSSSVFTAAALVNAPGGTTTPATVATAVWQDLLAGADFGTAGSIGLLLKGLTFTVANKIDANILYVNNQIVKGTGAPGSEWGPGP
jgi:hypothetical protein